MTELMALAEKLLSMDRAVALMIVIWLGANKKWVFGYQLIECEARAAAALLAAEKRIEEHKQDAHRATNQNEELVRLLQEMKSK